MDNSFDENDSIDLASVVAEFPHNDDHPNDQIPVKKLSTVFDGMVKPDEGNMKVYLRVRPFKGKEEGTIIIESDNSIVTNAPESSKRAQYTKTESRHYVSIASFVFFHRVPFLKSNIFCYNIADLYESVWRWFNSRRSL